jgi:hypothetical protein
MYSPSSLSISKSELMAISTQVISGAIRMLPEWSADCDVNLTI